MNPCVLDRGTLLVAPADSPHIFAFDAATGQMSGKPAAKWKTPPAFWAQRATG